MQETGNHQQDNEEDISITTGVDNDPVAYDEFMSANGLKEIPQDNLPFWQYQKPAKSKTQKTYQKKI